MSVRDWRVAAVVAWMSAMAVCGGAMASPGSSYQSVYDAVFSNPYASLPQHRVAAERFGREGAHADNRLRAAARRTLSVRDDLIEFPEGVKLLQPNGICFAGRWVIDRANPWTGLFASGTDIPVIARASVALSATRAGERRAFAVAVKLFPTLDLRAPVPTENFFVMETLTGTRKRQFLDAALDNEPDLGGIPGSFRDLDIGLRLRDDLTAVDAELSRGGPDYGYRPITALARVPAGREARAPRWIALEIAPGTPRIDAADFRDELRTAQYPGGALRYIVRVADAHPRGKRHADWQSVGALDLTDSITSPGCDGRLHFAHPRME